MEVLASPNTEEILGLLPNRQGLVRTKVWLPPNNNLADCRSDLSEPFDFWFWVYPTFPQNLSHSQPVLGTLFIQSPSLQRTYLQECWPNWRVGISERIWTSIVLFWRQPCYRYTTLISYYKVLPLCAPKYYTRLSDSCNSLNLEQTVQGARTTTNQNCEVIISLWR